MKVSKNNKNTKNREKKEGETLVRKVCIRKTTFPAIEKRGQEFIGI